MPPDSNNPFYNIDTQESQSKKGPSVAQQQSDPDEPPPPYEEAVPGGGWNGGSADGPGPGPGPGPVQKSSPGPPPQPPRPPPRPPSAASCAHSIPASGAPPQRPERPPGPVQNSSPGPLPQPPRPPPRPPCTASSAHSIPAPGAPPPRPVRPSSSQYGGQLYQPYQSQQSVQNQHFPRPNVPWVYPRGYWCKKCHNTGIKLKNGLSCQDCYARFARQNPNIQYVPPPVSYTGYSGYSPWRPTITTTIYPPPGRVVQPGDPSIGGILCGHCRGRGSIFDLLGDYTCPTCRGIGRLL